MNTKTLWARLRVALAVAGLIAVWTLILLALKAADTPWIGLS